MSEGPKKFESRPEVAPIVKSERSVSYGRAELPKADNRGNAPSQEQFADYYNGVFERELQEKIATAFALDQSPIIMGGTEIGKTAAIKKMCSELGYEVYSINLNHSTDAGDLMGRPDSNRERKSALDPEWIFADGQVTGAIRQEPGKIKVLILDEANAAKPGSLIRLFQVFDELERDGVVVLSEDGSERIPVNRANTKIIALGNPPGKGYLGREHLDPAFLRRMTLITEVEELPRESFRGNLHALFGLAEGGHAGDKERILSEIPGMPEILARYEEFHYGAKELLAKRQIAADQPQKFRFGDRTDTRRVRDYVAKFYRGDINQTVQDALRYYYSGKLLEPEDKEKLDELIRTVEFVAPQNTKRKGLDEEPEKAGLESSTYANANGELVKTTGAESLEGLKVGDAVRVRPGVSVEGNLKNAKYLTVVGFTENDEVITRITEGPVVVHSVDEHRRIFEADTSAERTATIEEAESIMGKEGFLGPKDVEKVFGVKVDRVPAIPFTKAELASAREFGQQLILQVDTISGETGLLGKREGALTIDTLRKRFDKKKAHDGGEMIYDQDWYKEEAFFKDEKPRVGWKLTTKEAIRDSESKNYLEQTDVIADYLVKNTFEKIPMPPEYRAAIDEWKKKRPEIEKLMSSDWQAASKALEELAITKLTRETPVEALYRLILQNGARSEKLLPSMYTWTGRRDSGGHLVLVGYFDSDGVGVSDDAPVNSHSPLGVCLSRMK